MEIRESLYNDQTVQTKLQSTGDRDWYDVNKQPKFPGGTGHVHQEYFYLAGEPE